VRLTNTEYFQEILLHRGFAKSNVIKAPLLLWQNKIGKIEEVHIHALGGVSQKIEIENGLVSRSGIL
jgi:hypothetical protein